MEPFFTAMIQLAPDGDGTRFTLIAMHRDPDGRKRHEEMEFHHDAAIGLDQFVAVMEEA